MAIARTEWKHPMIIDISSLKKVENLLKDRIAQPEIEISCSDNTEHHFRRVSQLEKCENTRRTQIESIRFYSKINYEKEARLTIKPYVSRTLEIEVRGSSQAAPKLRDDITDIMEGSKAWYWWLYKIDFVVALGVFYTCLWVVGVILISWVKLRNGSPLLENNSTSDGTIFGVISVLAILGGGISLNSFRNFFFPRMAFLIGQGIKRHEILVKIQWCVIIAFLVSFIASAIVACAS